MKQLPIVASAFLGVVIAASPLAAFAEYSVDASTSVKTEASVEKKEGARGFMQGIEARLDGRGKAEVDQKARLEEKRGTTSPERDGRKGEKSNDIAVVKARATKEIDGRITRLNAQIARIGSMERLSAEQKASITAELNAQVTALTTLKATIAAETDIAAVKEDLKSVTKAYRVYAVTMPKAAITAASDRIMHIVAQMEGFATKLSARVTAAGSSEATAALSDFNLKVADAKVQAQAAASLVAGLSADNGDATIAASNTAALKSAKEKIDAAQADLKAARKDIGTILKAIKGRGEVEAEAGT